jgi:hypothetical protein
MTTEQLEVLEPLGRRAVACKRWSWMPGMMAFVPAEHEGGTGYSVRVTQEHWERNSEFPSGTTPNMYDPATIGCLLALVRDVWGAGVYLLPNGGWYVKGARLKNGSSINLGIWGITESHALVSALEVAP